MTRTEELIQKAQTGDRDAMETLVEENTGLIWAVTRRYLSRGTEADDLYQLGCLGFLKAVEGFDLQYGTQFSTYAVPKISGEIRRFLRDDGAVKVSRSLKEQASSIRTVRNQLTAAGNRLSRKLPDKRGSHRKKLRWRKQLPLPRNPFTEKQVKKGFVWKIFFPIQNRKNAWWKK